MSKHGRVILDRMIEMIGAYEAGKVGLRGLVDDLGSMYQSLEPAEQLPARAWVDLFVPLDRLASEGEGRDHREIHRRIETHLARLKSMLARRARGSVE